MAENQNHTHSAAVCESYARAAFELADEAKSLDAIGDELQQIVALLGQHPDLAALFAHQALDLKRRAATIEKLFAGRVSPLTLNLLLVLNRKERLDQLTGVAQSFDRMAKERRGEVDVDLFTAKPLAASQLDKVASSVSASIGKKAVLAQHTDASLIGGLKLRIGDKLIDGSVAAQLRRMARQLNDSGTQIVRNAASKLLTN